MYEEVIEWDTCRCMYSICFWLISIEGGAVEIHESYGGILAAAYGDQSGRNSSACAEEMQ